MALDIEHLKRVYADKSNDELLESIFYKSADLLPEALDIVRDEFTKREGDINKYLRLETLKSGSPEFLLKAEYIGLHGQDSVTGNLYLTTQGIFFITTKYIANHVHGAFIGTLGPIGVIFEELVRLAVTQEITESDGHSNIPLSLLSRVTPYSYGKSISDIKTIQTWGSGASFGIYSEGERRQSFRISNDSVHLLKMWITSHGISVMETGGFIDCIKSLFK